MVAAAISDLVRTAWLSLAFDVGVAALCFDNAYVWRNMKVTTDDEGITVINQFRRRRRIGWDQIESFSIRGQVGPHGVVVLKSGRVRRLVALGESKLSIRAHPPSPELRQAIDELERDRINRMAKN